MNKYFRTLYLKIKSMQKLMTDEFMPQFQSRFTASINVLFQKTIELMKNNLFIYQLKHRYTRIVFIYY